MALFCKECAEKIGLLSDNPPFICEGCGKEILKQKSFLKIIYNKLRSKHD